MRAVIVPLTRIEHDVLRGAEDALRRCYGLEALSLTESAGMPLTAYSFERGQYNSVKVLSWLASAYRIERVDIIVGVADVDAYVEGLNFVFGTADSRLGTCVVYTRRLRESVDTRRYVERVSKEVIHEVGHLLGLEHCKSARCVMRFSNNVAEVDMKSDRLCRSCAAKLEVKGISVSPECII